MKKTTLAKMLGISCALCIASGAISMGVAKQAVAEENSTLVESTEWIDAWKGGAKAHYNMETGESVLTIPNYGQRAYNENKVKLDGLTVTMGSTQHKAGTRFGFGFTNVGDKYTLSEVTTLNVTWIPYQYDGQNRLYVNSNHAEGTICYKDAALTDNNNVFGLDRSFVAMGTEDDAYSFTFALVDDKEATNADIWSITVDVVRGTKYADQATPCTVYFSEASMPGVLDENGECYISAWGMENAGAFTLKMEDDNSKAYAATTLAAAHTAADEYIAAASGANDADSFSVAMEKRGALESAIALLRGNDKLVLGLKLAEGDTALAGAQDSVKASVQAEYDKAAAAVAVLEEESAITSENIASAVTALDNAVSVYDNMKDMLTDENKEYFLSLTEEYTYAIDYANACAWVIGWETEVEEVATLAEEQLIKGIVDAKAMRAAYVGSDVEVLVTEVLTAEDKAALETRILAADDAFAVVETANLAAVKADYLTKFEGTLADVDMTIKMNIDEARAAYKLLVENVEIEEADGDLYTRFTAAYATLKSACEAYVSAEIEAVDTLLAKEYKTLSAFKAVREKWTAIDLAYLMETSAEIEAAYGETKAAVEGNAFYYVNTTGAEVSDVEWTEDGLYFTEPGKHPQRFNYNKELDLVAGVKVTVCLEEAAFINTDMKAANNLCFNFLEDADFYKSESNGISVMIWLFGGESMVKVYTKTNERDAVATFSIPTPIDGSNLVIEISYHEDYYWLIEDAIMPAYVISVNEMAVPILASDIMEEGQTESITKAYFSMGSYMDKYDNPNCYSVISI
ncbi:MAG: hypothetical protein IKA57_06365, partial [Clostridia bacterium]|nr:hypothetical protein [Clostridia bacterium]